MADPFGALKQDHREVENLFARFEQSGDYQVAMEICRELSMHAVVEEELVYPLLRAKVSAGMADEARDEHQEAKNIITTIEGMDPGDELLRDTVLQLKDAIQHHVEEEEGEVFPRMEKELPELVSTLGPDVEQRKEQLLKQVESDKALNLPPSASAQKPVASQGSVTGEQPREAP